MFAFAATNVIRESQREWRIYFLFICMLLYILFGMHIVVYSVANLFIKALRIHDSYLINTSHIILLSVDSCLVCYQRKTSRTHFYRTLNKNIGLVAFK